MNIEVVANLRTELYQAGFSTRSINVLLDGLKIAPLGEIEELPWGDRREPGTLAWRLLVAPNCGPMVVAEVKAFRSGTLKRTVETDGAFMFARVSNLRWFLPWTSGSPSSRSV